MSGPARTGDTFICKVCKREFYRSPSQVRNGATKTCSKACLSQAWKGENNPFWNRTHTAETRAKISAARKGKAVGNQNAKGYKHTEEAKKKIQEASLRLWSEGRDKMLACFPKGWKSALYKPKELLRHRRFFSPRDRKELLAKECAYCGRTEFLELDHIIPIFDGGDNVAANAQTLCRYCNLWKVKHVDLPRYFARLGCQRD